MMTQTMAILLDAYRELQSKKMFWIVLILNVLAIAAFSLVGADDHSLKVLWFEVLPNMRPGDASLAYKYIFSYLIVGFWFTWLASLLALISTAGIFPEFLASGSVDLFLSKPISRLRLFFTKYIAGLLFVALQITVFTVLCFFILGIRGHVWEPGLFLAIPLVLIFFSYLFSICVLLGTVTRSTIAALLVTLLAWFGIWALDRVDSFVQGARAEAGIMQADIDDQIDDLDARIATLKAQTQPAPGLAGLEDQRTQLVARRGQLEIPQGLITTQNVALGIKSVTPKTRETTNLLDRVLFRDAELQEAVKRSEQSAATAPQPEMGPRRGRGGRHVEARRAELLTLDRERPIWWIIGTSLLFEGVCLALAAWIFCTRDF